MSSSTLRLVLLVSCCHALVHVYEHSFASVELLVASDFGIDTETTGVLATCLGLPFGLFALAAGWLADRFGAKRLLLVYLIGCSAAGVLAFFSSTLAALGLAMFSLGTFASIYHPAGVGLISHHTNAENRPMALGYHGIFGSAGIAAGPFLAALVLGTGASWTEYYLLLAVPGVLLAIFLSRKLSTEEPHREPGDEAAANGAQWGCYALLLATAVTAGFVYKAVITFMPRYLAGSGLDLAAMSDWFLNAIGLSGPAAGSVTAGNILTGMVLLLGILGQYVAGRVARPHTLELLMGLAFFASVPCLVGMGFAEGAFRVWIAALFSVVFFMHQPLYNSLVSKYTPRRRRGFAYGLSFTMGFGVGSLGSTFAGQVKSNLLNYSVLAAIACVVGILSLVLWALNRPQPGKGDNRPVEGNQQPPAEPVA